MAQEINFSRGTDLQGWEIGDIVMLNMGGENSEKILRPMLLLNSPYECVVDRPSGDSESGRFVLLVEDNRAIGPRICRQGFLTANKDLWLIRGDDKMHLVKDITNPDRTVGRDEYITDGANMLLQNKTEIQKMFSDKRKQLSKQGDIESVGWGFYRARRLPEMSEEISDLEKELG